jgi:hypothetical protein
MSCATCTFSLHYSSDSTTSAPFCLSFLPLTLSSFLLPIAHKSIVYIHFSFPRLTIVDFLASLLLLLTSLNLPFVLRPDNKPDDILIPDPGWVRTTIDTVDVACEGRSEISGLVYWSRGRETIVDLRDGFV